MRDLKDFLQELACLEDSLRESYKQVMNIRSVVDKEDELKQRLRYLLNECENVKSDAIMLEREIDLTFGKDFLKREEEL